MVVALRRTDVWTRIPQIPAVYMVVPQYDLGQRSGRSHRQGVSASDESGRTDGMQCGRRRNFKDVEMFPVRRQETEEGNLHRQQEAVRTAPIEVIPLE